MPVYEYACLKCGKHKDQYARIEERDSAIPECCDSRMERVLTCASVMPDIQPYRSQVTGQMIESRSQHREMLKNTGCVEIGDQHQQHQEHIAKRKAEQEKRESAKLRQDIADRINSIT